MQKRNATLISALQVLALLSEVVARMITLLFSRKLGDRAADEGCKVTAHDEAIAMAVYSVGIIMPQLQIVEAGSTVVHSFRILNRGEQDDTYSVKLEFATEWIDASAVPSVTSIPHGCSAEFTIAIHVPLTTALDEEELLEIYVKGHSRDYARTRIIIKFNPSFSDLPTDAYQYNDAVFVVRRGILNDQTTPEGTQLFRPDALVTRAEFAHALVQAYAKSDSSPLNGRDLVVRNLSDVSTKHPNYYDIQAVITCNLLPTEGARFLPEEVVQRGQAASAVMKAQGLIAYEQLPPYFADVAPSHPHFDAIQTLAVKRKVPVFPFHEDASAYFRPDEPITRAELSKIVRLTLRG